MGRQFTISNIGLKLIKAYEGYRPVDRMLVSGQRVIGYGHRILDEDTTFLSKSEAEDVLKADLAPFEDMINENVHAPLTQSQFDALCSFAFNIGPKAFLQSDTLRAINNGRPLDAANGFDIWRKSEIDGKTYVVDALMRRRTAEKALFLRPPGRTLSAPRVDLPPVSDETVALLRTEDALPVFSSEESAGVVGTVPYDMQAVQNRRRTDGPSGILSLSDVYDGDEADSDELLLDTSTAIEDIKPDEGQKKPSLIAVEEEKLKDRLDALIEDVKSDQKGIDTSEWPESLISSEEPEEIIETDNVIKFKANEDVTFEDDTSSVVAASETPSVDLVIDELKEDEPPKVRTEDSASKFIELESAAEAKPNSTFPYWVMIVFGSGLFGASVATYLKGAEVLLGESGPMIAFSGALIGGMMLFGALYYAFRKTLSRLSDDE